MNKYTCIGHISDDLESIKIFDKLYAKRFLGDIKNYTLDIIIKPRKNKRSIGINRWLWGVCYPCIIEWVYETTGDVITSDELHLKITTEVLGGSIKEVTIAGDTYFKIDRIETSKLTSKEFNEFKNKIQRHYAEKGLNIPDPYEYSI